MVHTPFPKLAAALYDISHLAPNYIKGPMLVYRMQDAKGRGPFKPGFSEFWLGDTSSRGHLLSVSESFPSLSFPVGGHLGCGCESEEGLRAWFTEGEYSWLLQFGYKAVKLRVDKVLARDANQVVFQRKRPLYSGVKKFRLY